MQSDNKSFEITGKHVLFAMILFFGVIIATNMVFVKLALGSFPGEQVEKSYYQGLYYNDVLAEKARQADAGWRMQLKEVPLIGTAPVFEVKVVNRDGKPVYDAVLQGEIVRPMTDRGRQALTFYGIGDGVYRAQLSAIEPGAWNLSLTAAERGEGSPLLAARTRILVK